MPGQYRLGYIDERVSGWTSPRAVGGPETLNRIILQAGDKELLYLNKFEKL